MNNTFNFKGNIGTKVFCIELLSLVIVPIVILLLRKLGYLLVGSLESFYGGRPSWSRLYFGYQIVWLLSLCAYLEYVMYQALDVDRILV